MSKNRYIGKYDEGKIREIKIPFTRVSLIGLIDSVINNINEYTHQEIVNWCDNFYIHLLEERNYDRNVFEVLQDISVQWETYLPNTYSLDELQKMDFSEVKLPVSWFKNWKTGLKRDFEIIVEDIIQIEGRGYVVVGIFNGNILNVGDILEIEENGKLLDGVIKVKGFEMINYLNSKKEKKGGILIDIGKIDKSYLIGKILFKS